MSESVWPLFDLRVTTPVLELRYATDELLQRAVRHHSQGVFAPGAEPFDGDSSFYASSPDAERRFLLGEWGARAKTSKEWWHLSFAVLVDDEVVGMQDITGVSFPTVRTVSSFSFLGLAHQGKGIGKEMRTAVLHLAFGGLGARRAESDAFDDNPASQAVSRALGYRPNGTMLATRPSGASVMSRFLLTAEDWAETPAGQRDDIEIVGLGAALPVLGLGPTQPGTS